MFNDKSHLVFICSALICLRLSELATHSLILRSGLGTKQSTFIYCTNSLTNKDIKTLQNVDLFYYLLFIFII